MSTKTQERPAKMLEWAKRQPTAEECGEGRHRGERWTAYRPALRVLVKEKGYTVAVAVRLVARVADLNEEGSELLHRAVRNWKRKGTF